MWFYFSIFILFLTLIFCQQSRYIKYIYIIEVVLLILIAGFRGNIDKDYSGYLDIFTSIKNRDQGSDIESTYYFISSLYPSISFVMVTYALISISIKYVALKKLTPYYLFSSFLYISHYFILHEMTQIRAGASVSFFLLSIPAIYYKKYIAFIFFSLGAILFHLSAIPAILLLLLLPKTKKYSFLIYVFVPLCYCLNFLGYNISSIIYMLFNDETGRLYLYKINSVDLPTVNVFNPAQISRCVILIGLFLTWNLLQKKNVCTNLLIYCYTLSIGFYVLFSDIPALSSRLSEYIGIVEIILVPMFISIINPKYIAYLFIFLWAFALFCTDLFYTKMLTNYF
jgi:hypothetical protein